MQELFGIDISSFTRNQQTFLLRWRYARTQNEVVEELGISEAAVSKWKREDPLFASAMKQVRQKALEVDIKGAEEPHLASIRSEISEKVAQGALKAIDELRKFVDLDLEKCDRTEKLTKLRACEDFLRLHGADGGTPGEKLDIISLIHAIEERNKLLIGGKDATRKEGENSL